MIQPYSSPTVDVNAPLRGVWVETDDVSVDDASKARSPHKRPKTHMAMPSDPMVSSSSSFQTGTSSVFTLWRPEGPAAPVVETSLWQWMVMYAAPFCMETSAQELVFEHLSFTCFSRTLHCK